MLREMYGRKGHGSQVLTYGIHKLLKQ